MGAERCRCGTCKRFIGHMANDDHSCSRCCNKPVWKEGDVWQPIICPPCRAILKDSFDWPRRGKSTVKDDFREQA